MKNKKRSQDIKDTIIFYGADVLDSPKYRKSDQYMQHGDISVLEHSISVACVCLRLAKLTPIKHDYSSLVRGSLLHDYFNYDWHKPHGGHLHGYRHADKALINASNDFSINPTEANMITRHMFPLNIRPPRNREAILLCIADKICALKETFSKPFYNDLVREIKRC